MDETEEIELRSEKVRNIIGQIPSRIIRMGITVIFVVFLALLAGAYFFRFDRTIDTQTTVYMKNNRVHYTIEIPYNKLRYLEAGQKLVITIPDGNSFATTIQDIDSTMHINNEQTYYRIDGVINNSKLKVDEQLEAWVTIYIGQTNLIDYVLNN